MSDSTELQYWASSLLLNLTMSSDDARSRMIKDGGVGVLLEMAVKESEVPQITSQASKILVMLGFAGFLHKYFTVCHRQTFWWAYIQRGLYSEGLLG